jgi:hypothetical protein
MNTTISDTPESDSAETDRLVVEVVTSMRDVRAEDWDRCLGSDHPFMRHAFLCALEDSGSAVAETGWLGQHLLLKDDGALIGVMPMYLKNHSAGEYVFDHGWAEAFARAGGQYYPKLQVSVPFTPAMGPRLLVDPVHPDPAWARRALLTAATQRCEQIGASSIHITFPTEPEWTAMGEAGLLQRTGVQFHWENDNYADFDAFLATLSSRKRKQIKKERREALPEGLTITALSGDEIKEHHWDAFFVFYQENGARKWGTPYLTRTFFSLLGERMGDQVVLVMAERDGRPIAGALNLMGDGTLYGRNWGCIEDHRFLHFEACYYQAIDYAIKHGLGRVEAGAQGPHKLARGYLPITTYSAHWITHPGLREAIGQYLEREVNEVDWEIEALSKHSPYRKPD